MGNKKSSLSKVFLVIAIILIVVMGALLYMQKTEADRQIAELKSNASELQEAINKLQEKNDLTTNTIDSKNIYEKCENKFSNVEYRRETGGSSGFFIKDGVLYSGEENLTETHSKTTGVEGKAKYVVPVNKQVFETIVLTEEGKLFINKLDSNDVYGNDFYSILKEYKILEIINIPNENGHLLLASDGKILKLDGTLYLDLLKEVNNSVVTNNAEDKNVEQPSNEYSIEKIITWSPNTTSYDFNTKQWWPNDLAEYYVATDKDKKLCIVDKEKNLVKKFDIVITDIISSAYVLEWENTLTIIQKDATAYDINITDFTYGQYQYADGY